MISKVHLFKSRIQKWIFINAMTQSTVIEKPKNQFLKAFENKSFVQLEKIMSLNITPKNDQRICSIVLDLTNLRIETEAFKQHSQDEIAARQAAVNKALDKLLTTYLKNLSPSQFLLICQSYYKINNSRYLKIGDHIKQKFKQNQLEKHLQYLVNQQQIKKYPQTFLKILFIMLRIKKKRQVIRSILEYFIDNDLRTRERILYFFQQYMHHDRANTYDSLLETLLGRYFDLKQNTVENGLEWAKPIVLKVLLLFEQSLQMKNNQRLNLFMTVIEKQLEKGRIPLDEKVDLLKNFMDWSKICAPYNLKTKGIKRVTNLLWKIVESIEKEIFEKEVIEYNKLVNLFKILENIKYFSQISQAVLQKSMTEITSRLNTLLVKCFEKSVINQFENLNSSQIIGSLRYMPELPAETQVIFCDKLINFISLYNHQKNIINNMRILEHVTIKCLENPNVKKSKIQPQIRKLEKESASYKSYEMLRLYNICRLLEVKSVQFENFFKSLLSRKEDIVIENFVRTKLRYYSYPVIMDALNKYFKKYSESDVIESHPVQFFCFLFKKIEAQSIIDNRNPIFLELFYERWDIFGKIARDFKMTHIMIGTSIKDLNYKSRENGVSSLNFQFLFQILRTLQKQGEKGENIEKFCYFNLKNIIQSQQFISLALSKNYRFSFFPKIIWVWTMIGTHTLENFKQKAAKRYQNNDYLLTLAKQQKPTLLREKYNLRAQLIMKSFNVLVQQKKQTQKYLTGLLTWTKYHRLTPNLLLNMKQVSQLKQRVFNQLFSKMNYKKVKNLWEKSEKIELLFNFRFHENMSSQELKALQKDFIQYFFFQRNTVNENAQSSQSFTLDILSYSQILKYAFSQDNSRCEKFVNQLLLVNNPLQSFKIIEASNIVQASIHLLNKDIRIKFKQWVQDRLLTYFHPARNPSEYITYLQFNISNPQIFPYIDAEVKKNLVHGNFFIIPLLYINDYPGIQKQLYQAAWVTLGNKNCEYFADYYKSQYLGLINSFIGLSLNQSSVKTLKFVLEKYLNIDLVEKILKVSQEENKQATYQFFILTQVAKNRYPELKQLDLISNLLTKNIQSKIGRYLSDRNSKILSQHSVKIQTENGFHIINHKKLLLVDRQPGFSKLAAQYLEIDSGAGSVAMHEIEDLEFQQK